MEGRASLLPSVHGLLTHLNQTSLGLAIGEVTDGSNSLVGVFLGKNTSLLNTVALVDKLTGLING